MAALFGYVLLSIFWLILSGSSGAEVVAPQTQAVMLHEGHVDEHRRLRPQAGLKNYQSEEDLTGDQSNDGAIHIAETTVETPLGQKFKVHLWAHRHSLPQIACKKPDLQLLQSEMSQALHEKKEEKKKPLLQILKETANAIDPEGPEHEPEQPDYKPDDHPDLIPEAQRIMRPHKKLRNCCTEYYVYISIAPKEHQPSEPWQRLMALYAKNHGGADWEKHDGAGQVPEDDNLEAVHPQVDHIVPPHDPTNTERMS